MALMQQNRQPTAGPDPGPNRARRRHDDEWLANRLAVSPFEAGQVMGLSRDTVYKLMNDGTIASVKLGGRRLIRTSELRRLLGEVEAD